MTAKLSLWECQDELAAVRQCPRHKAIAAKATLAGRNRRATQPGAQSRFSSCARRAASRISKSPEARPPRVRATSRTAPVTAPPTGTTRSEENTYELQSLMRL